MAGGEEKNRGEGKGFAGLSSLVSDVDASLPPPVEQNMADSDVSSSLERPAASENVPLEPQSSRQQPYQASPSSSSGSSTGKWVLGIAAVIGVFWFIGQGSEEPLSSDSSYSSPAQATAPSYSEAPVEPQVPLRPEEARPPIGQGLVFSVAQIRYCLAEDIRMDGAKSAANNYSDADVEQFNAMVADYNSRCGNFRYKSGALESARRDIEPYRSELQAEGKSRFARSPSTSSLLAPDPAPSAPDETVQAIQQKLNELGYDAGFPDGLMGEGTRSAIVAFQQDAGLTQDGRPTLSLLQHLLDKHQSIARGAPKAVTPTSPSFSAAPPAVTPSQPVSSSLEESVTATEQSAIERACDSARLYSGPSAYQACLAREMASLKSSGGSPDLSHVTDFERKSIERACNSARQYSGPGAYYGCLKRELASLNASQGHPDLSGASPTEQAAIERACDSARQYSGPGAYYNCLNRELSSLTASRGRPDFSQFTSFEQTAIERSCNSARQYSGPGAYYNCLHREISSLRSSGGAPDLSILTSTASAAVERACESSRQYSGPGTYYNCLRRELNKVGYR